jgi:hypothetical protein
MAHFSARSATGAVAAVAAGVAASVVGLGLVPAAADMPSSTLLTSVPSVSLDIGGPTTGTVNVGLDSGCMNAFDNPKGHGQSYGIKGTSANAAVAGVSDEQDGLHCSTDNPVTLPAQFTISTFAYPTDTTDPAYESKRAAACGAVGSTTVTFYPVAGPHGQSDKMHPSAPVTVTVSNNTPLDCSSIVPPPPTNDGNMAAPAVANFYLNNNPDVTTACQKQFGPKAWRGNLISAIAHWMPIPECIKDNGQVFPANDWVTYISSEVDTACKDGKTVTYLVPTTVPPLPALQTLN